MADNVLLLNSKKVYSCFSDELVTFVKSLDSITEDAKGVFSDGINLVDCIAEVQDDIQKMYFVMKDGSIENCQDFYAEHGAYEKDSNFIEDIKNLVADR